MIMLPSRLGVPASVGASDAVHSAWRPARRLGWGVLLGSVAATLLTISNGPGRSDDANTIAQAAFDLV